MAVLILKTVERCNINCKYCYFFNKSDQTYIKHPPYISRKIIDKVALFIAQGCKDLSLSKLLITFHGGEPLMQKKSDFDYMCNKILYETNHISCEISFSIQTNAMLINQDWIDLFNKYSVSVGISIDGPKIYHDMNRIDKKGKGTHDKTVSCIKLIQQGKKNFELGILTVINPNFSPSKIFNYFVNELNIYKFDFLLPDAHHDDLPEYHPNKYGDFFCEIFNEIDNIDLEKVNIRFINSILSSFLTNDNSTISSNESLQPITISTNGDLSPVDDLRNTDLTLMYTDNIDNTSFKKFLKGPIFKSLLEAENHLPESCEQCCWSKVCKGGYLIHRYSKEKGFKDKSIYCEGLKKVYGRAASYLLKEGISLKTLESKLGI